MRLCASSNVAVGTIVTGLLASTGIAAAGIADKIAHSGFGLLIAAIAVATAAVLTLIFVAPKDDRYSVLAERLAIGASLAAVMLMLVGS
jgi:hypothetical protein